MTYVQYINCDKWKKVIGISLWSGVTIGLIIFGITSIQWLTDLPNHYKMTDNDYYFAYGWMIIPFGLISCNKIMIWRTLNNHYRWIEIRCGSKPINHLTERSSD